MNCAASGRSSGMDRLPGVGLPQGESAALGTHSAICRDRLPACLYGIMYYLLPFRFHVMQGKELLINDLGDFLLVPGGGSVERIVNRAIDTDGDLYKDLLASFFISEQPLPRLIDTMAIRLAARKAFLNHFTALHIFVLTLRCNPNCIYCQASNKENHCSGYDVEEADLFRAIDLMFCSPSPALTMEIQGGEPTLVPDLIRKAIE